MSSTEDYDWWCSVQHMHGYGSEPGQMRPPDPDGMFSADRFCGGVQARILWGMWKGHTYSTTGDSGPAGFHFTKVDKIAAKLTNQQYKPVSTGWLTSRILFFADAMPPLDDDGKPGIATENAGYNATMNAGQALKDWFTPLAMHGQSLFLELEPPTSRVTDGVPVWEEKPGLHPANDRCFKWIADGKYDAWIKGFANSIFDALKFIQENAPSPGKAKLRPIVCVKFASEMDNPRAHKYGVIVPSTGIATGYHAQKASDYRAAFERIVKLFEGNKEWSKWKAQIKFAWCPTARRDLARLEAGEDPFDPDAWNTDEDDAPLDQPLIKALYPSGVNIEFVGFHAYGTWRAGRPTEQDKINYPWVDKCAYMEEASAWWRPPEYYFGPALRALTNFFKRSKRYLLGEFGVASIPSYVHEAVIASAKAQQYKNNKLRLALRIDKSDLHTWVDRLFSKRFWIRRAAEYLRLWSQVRNIHLTVLLFEENKIEYGPSPDKCQPPDVVKERDWSFTNVGPESYETKGELLEALASAMVMGYPGGYELSGWNWSAMDGTPVSTYRWYALTKEKMDKLGAEISSHYGDSTIYDQDSLPIPEGFQP